MDMDTQPTVFVVDDDEFVARALARVLQADGFFTKVWTSARAFLADHDPDAPGCLITDLIMPEMGGLELQRLLLERRCLRSTIFVTARGDVPSTVAGMRAGAISFLTKPVRSVDLLAAVREAIAHDVADRSLQAERRCVRDRLLSLTPRERQVLELVTKGLLNKQIAAALGAAEKTIKVHRGRLMHKMRARSAAALVMMLADSRADEAGSWEQLAWSVGPSPAERPATP
jgi:FixJ family two-component response regulator